jgi:hypothetical protein
MRYLSGLPVVLSTLVTFASAAGAQVQYYSVFDGSQAGTSSNAGGMGWYTINTGLNTLVYFVDLHGMTTAASGAHIHGPAVPGSTGAIAFQLDPSFPMIGTWDYPQSLEAGILRGLYYVDVHTAQFPGGEIRGQIVVSPVEHCLCPIDVAPCANADGHDGCTNSTGSGARIWSFGMPTTTLDSLALSAVYLPPDEVGFFFMGSEQTGVPFGDGRQCVGPTVYRYAPVLSSASGSIDLGPGIARLSRTRFPPSGRIMPGQSWSFQCAYRDQAGPCGFGANVTSALRVSFTP